MVITREYTDQRDVDDKEFYTDDVKEIIDEVSKVRLGLYAGTYGLYINDRIVYPMFLRELFKNENNIRRHIPAYDYE